MNLFSDHGTALSTPLVKVLINYFSVSRLKSSVRMVQLVYLLSAVVQTVDERRKAVLPGVNIETCPEFL